MTCPCCGFDPDAKGLTVIGQKTKMTPQERIVFNYLSRNFGGAVETERLFQALYADDPDGGPLTAKNVLAVIVMKLRKKIARDGLSIDATRGPGAYRRMRWSTESERAAAQ